MADGVDIDLYAEDLDSDLNQESDYNHDSNVDLYDDVITASNNGAASEENQRASSKSSSSGKRVSVYVGNLTWWTTDQDVTDAINSIGVNDVYEIKFYENRANGQSKGFCIVTLGSENAFQVVLEKLPKKDIHGQNPVVTPCSRQNLNHFEMQSRKPGQSSSRSDSDRERERDREKSSSRSTSQSGRNHRDSHSPYSRGIAGLPLGPPPNQGPPLQFQTLPPQIQGPPPIRPPLPPGIPPLPPGLHGIPPPRPGTLPPGLLRIPPPRGPPPPLGPRNPLLDPRGPPPEWDPRSPLSHSLVPTLPPSRPPPPVPVPGLPPTIPPPSVHPPAPHVNPAFFSQPPPTSQPGDIYSRPPPAQYSDLRDRHESSIQSLNETEFEELMSRNRTVSSSAIGRAVADASAGDFAAAIETLVTAISLIKQSKVSNDDRCKILISSLQDTLHGIESKSYGSRTKERARSRERERSRERPSRREKPSRRERSRSREREYRERSRERDRYHEDRYREKERDREREHRSRH
ncbi:CPSF6 [Cordylochernes scorpioides]|uniref:Cleavage and polyadenylation specificity factor subunit 6 n=1 Tax=Cordylochernes scorpioides TaxID=51811 RepID=A0ABY6JY81_9ARAC|nr:CPSF6 [Cordylochernes scorpioides]UYV61006.1 CPSF6 [Cordylochernes scorpioides]